jgi:predicted ATPase
MAYRIPSFRYSECACLFEERARAANPSFALMEANAASVAQLCARLDGIPLAIELAPAHTRLLSAEQIASRLNDRFRLLVGGSRMALLRQQTLLALIDWSYDMFSEEE